MQMTSRQRVEAAINFRKTDRVPIDRVRIFGDGGGFVFTTVYNIQHGVPCENLIAMYETASGIQIGR